LATICALCKGLVRFSITGRTWLPYAILPNLPLISRLYDNDHKKGFRKAGPFDASASIGSFIFQLVAIQSKR
jgi:hypothetical protein